MQQSDQALLCPYQSAHAGLVSEPEAQQTPVGKSKGESLDFHADLLKDEGNEAVFIKHMHRNIHPCVVHFTLNRIHSLPCF